MKLLIDIPEDAFNDCKLCCENRVAIWQEEIIAKGIPCEEIPQDKWVGINEYLKHLEDTTGEKYKTSGLYKHEPIAQENGGKKAVILYEKESDK